MTKASLLSGVGFALAMSWGQTGRSCHDLSCRTGFGSPLLDMINHVELWPRPVGSNPAASIPLGFHLRPHVRMPMRTHIQDSIDRNCCPRNVMQPVIHIIQCSLMPLSTAVRSRNFMPCYVMFWENIHLESCTPFPQEVCMKTWPSPGEESRRASIFPSISCSMDACANYQVQGWIFCVVDIYIYKYIAIYT